MFSRISDLQKSLRLELFGWLLDAFRFEELRPVPFHSFAHAVDVLHGVSRVLRCICSNTILSELEESGAESGVKSIEIDRNRNR